MKISPVLISMSKDKLANKQQYYQLEITNIYLKDSCNAE